MIGEVTLEDRRAERDGAEARDVVGRVIGEADHGVRKCLAQFDHRSQANEMRRRRIEIRRVHQRVRNAGAVENLDGFPHALNRVHAGAENDRLAEAGDVFQQRIVVALARSDLVGRHVHAVQPVSRRAREGRADEDHPLRFDVLLQQLLVGFRQRATLHDLVDRHGGVARHHLPGGAAHLVFDDVGLMLDDFDAGASGGIDHLLGDGEAALVIDADFGDDERSDAPARSSFR